LSTDDAARLMRFVLEMRQAGVTDARALAALERTPRAHYAPAHLAGLAMDDMALPLARSQIMTKPSVVGRMLAALAVMDNESVLEVGTGSGFQAAALATTARKVVTLERLRDLAAEARGRLGEARLLHVFAHAADGFDGWEEDAPYDRIIVNGATSDLPLALLDQLKAGGTLIAPVGAPDTQRLMRYRNGIIDDLGPIKFQSLERGVE